MFNRRRTLLIVSGLILTFASEVLSNLVVGAPMNLLELFADWVATLFITAVFGGLLLFLMEKHKREVLTDHEPEGLTPRDMVHSRSTPVATRRLVAGLSQFVLNDGGYCLRCWIPFAVSNHHITPVRYPQNQAGYLESMIVLCEYCFLTCDHEERVRYYGQQYGNLVGKGMQPRVIEWDAVVKALRVEHHTLHDAATETEDHEFAA